MMFRLTPVVKFIIITVAVVYVLSIIAYNTNSPYADILALKMYNGRGFMPFQVFTYMFAHSNETFMHVFFNMLMFAFFGPQLEEFLGAKRFGNFLMICGLGVGFSWMIWHSMIGSPPVYSIRGFSGVLFGVFSLMGLYFPDREIRLLFPPIPVKLKYLVLVYIAIEFYSLIRGSNDNVSHISHLLGVVFAVIMFKVWEIIDNK